MNKLGFISLITFCSLISLCSSIAFAQIEEPIGDSSTLPNEAELHPITPSWSYGKIDIVESFSDKIQVRWNGPRTQSCSNTNAVVLTENSVGGKDAFDRAFKIVLTAAVSGRLIRFKLFRCIDEFQRGEVVQLCTNPECRY